MEMPGEVVSRLAILRAVYGQGFQDRKRVLDVHVCHVRRKLRRLSGIELRTIRHVGFALTGAATITPSGSRASRAAVS
jgi:DNA-binding response OmpR family regulator